MCIIHSYVYDYEKVMPVYFYTVKYNIQCEQDGILPYATQTCGVTVAICLFLESAMHSIAVDPFRLTFFPPLHSNSMYCKEMTSFGNSCDDFCLLKTKTTLRWIEIHLDSVKIVRRNNERGSLS